MESATRLVSHAAGDTQVRAAGDMRGAAISASGKQVVFSTYAPDVVGGDLNDLSDAFWWSAENVSLALFADGFVSGDSSAWSATAP
ncbi:MAG: hypothetical protein ABI639_09015 [Thermoanaerobaculia bacterium]